MNDKWEILHGDALKLLGGFAPGAFDAVITDPPYASGGRTQAEKNKSTAKKYSSMGDHAPPPFDGDAKDQRSWTRWAAEWLGDARKICKPGAPVCMFIDWRQLPAATDALQWAGWIWRGTAVWDKGNSRPQKGRFRQQAEYIVWGSNGDMPINRPVPCLPGVFKYGNPQNRIHLTEKPLPLMRDVVKITEPGGHILDPFAGSGTTILAAVLEGYTATGIEVTGEYARRARERIEQELRQAASTWPSTLSFLSVRRRQGYLRRLHHKPGSDAKLPNGGEDNIPCQLRGVAVPRTVSIPEFPHVGIVRKLPQNILRLRQQSERPTPPGRRAERVCQNLRRQGAAIELT